MMFKEWGNLKIKNFNTNKWLETKEKVRDAIKDILFNNSESYSYNKRVAKHMNDRYNIIKI